jgi:exopolyphosphatase
MAQPANGGGKAITEFLRVGASALRSLAGAKGDKKIVGVLGNEGGDMDSVVGALYTALAINFEAIRVPTLERACKQSDRVVVPFLNFPAEDLPLRGDILGALKQQGVDTEAFVSATDHPELLAACDYVVLFDHNELKKDQRHLDDRVVAVIDHHEDGKKYADASPRFIRKCGSCCTLLAHVAGLQHAAALPCASPLLLGAIVLDTMNFDPAVKKTTALDVQAATALLSDGDIDALPKSDDLSAWDAADQHAAVDKLQHSCHSLYGYLSDRKTDVSHLTIAQNLRRDFKVFTFKLVGGKTLTIGFSAWLESLPEVVARHGLSELVNGFHRFSSRGAEDDALDALIVMFAFGKGTSAFRRQALWWVPKRGDNSQTADQALKRFFIDDERNCGDKGPRFREDATLSAAVAAVADDETLSLHCVAQDATEISRKALVPLMTEQLAAGSA